MKLWNVLLTFPVLTLGMMEAGLAQVPAPTPTPISINSSCIKSGVERTTRIINGDFETTPADGQTPLGWDVGNSGMGGILHSQVLSDNTVNHYVEFLSDSSLTQVPSVNTLTTSTVYQIHFCYVVRSGVIQVYIGGVLQLQYPTTASDTVANGVYASKELYINLRNQTEAEANRVELRFVATQNDGYAYIDNFELIPFLAGSTPTPSPVQATPSPSPSPTRKPTERPTPAQTPTPGPTPTPTPGWTSYSVQLIANPPMLVVSPDDFSNRQGIQKQISLNYQIIGSNNEPIDITKIDPEATIQFSISNLGETAEVGRFSQMDSNSGNQKYITTERIKLSDLGKDPIYFVPQKPYDGPVRIVMEIEYDGYYQSRKQRVNLKGVVPIFMSVDKGGSLTNATGTFNAAQNNAIGRQPGDRGFRPDVRTNLYFRERLE